MYYFIFLNEKNMNAIGKIYYFYRIDKKSTMIFSVKEILN
jgi:hypothetical protein